MQQSCKALLFLCGLLYAAGLIAQPTGYSYDREKLYVHTNHVFFTPGETVFFKAYLVKGSDNRPSRLSTTAYVEITGPSGTMIEQQTYAVENGYCEGSFTLDGQAAGGIYKLKAYTGWMLNEKDSCFFTKEFTVQKIIAPRVLMKLDFPQKGYGPGNVVTADFSMRNLNDEPIKNHSGKYTVSLAGSEAIKAVFQTDANGKAKISFTLPSSLQTADGLLNIAIAYDSYTESISRSIPITLNNIDLQFMPEGGSLVAGLTTNIAFRAIDEFGKPVDIKGVIKNRDGAVVASFDSYKFGMGQFQFTPLAGETYTARIISPANISASYALPAAAEKGVVMNIGRQDGKILLTLGATTATVIRIIGQARNTSCYSQHLQLAKGSNTITVEEHLFPTGIAVFSLYAENNKPLAERLVFCNLDQNLHVSISTDKKKYLPREKVSLTISTTDRQAKPIPSNFSLSVLDDKLWTMADDKQDNILSWLLLHSELRGKIEEPAFYFKPDEPKSLTALDLVMLTHGYRYFDFIDDVARTEKLKFAPEIGNIVSGIVTNDKDQPSPATVFLINNKTGGKAVKTQSGSDGRFLFANIVEKGSYMLMAQPLQHKDRVKINLTQYGKNIYAIKDISINKPNFNAGPEEIDITKPVIKDNPKPAAQPVLQPAQKQQFPDFNKTNALNDVVVVGYGYALKRDVTGSVSILGAKQLNAAPEGGMMQALQGKVAGLVVTPSANPGATPSIMIRGARTLANNNEPLIIINGVPQEKYDLSGININEIDHIDILKDAAAVAIYGARAVNGVIQITTRTPRDEKIRFDLSPPSYIGVKTFTLEGLNLTVARHFYMPRYKSTVTEERNDYRETIYWNPTVQTDRDGRATVEFYNSDATTTFRAIAEGIGFNGKPGRAETTYTAEAAMSVDARIPPDLTAGDHALIPLVIRNNSTEKLDARIDVSLPVNMYTEKFDSALTLDPGVSKQVLIPLSATTAVNGQIRFNITGNLSNETITLPVSAADKGFPVANTYSGNMTEKHDVLIGRMIPGSLHAKLSLFKDVEGQLLNGIESMLREPYGCFEQTSSSTYPNIFILKYLRQAGKSNPAIEKLARGYIDRGYKRLIGYETSEDGFEWFGHAPAHEALTAYGLLEFTDMQEFVDVDKKMLLRTKDFLLKRRDGHGAFKLVSNGLDEFASVPARIANIYIVYALTQAGYGSEIKPEYQVAVRQAIKSNDTYQMAMMALAASNMKNNEDYRLLIDQLNGNYSKYRLSSETSVVNSRDASLRVESMALYALALMRSKMAYIGTVSQLLSKILHEKSYYGYGSTQGTVLALQAITEYARLAGEQVQQTKMNFVVNDKVISPEDSISPLLHEGQNTFTVEYDGNTKGLPYSLEVSYQTYTPPNSPKAELQLRSSLNNTHPKLGETVRMNIAVSNIKSTLQPMTIAKIGIPAGLSLQPWQLKELTENHKVAYYEIFDHYLVLYWMGFAANETKEIALDLKAEIPGTYKARAGNVYLYYTPEYKNWNEGLELTIRP